MTSWFERAGQTSRPDLIGQAFLDHARLPLSVHDFVRLIRLAYPDLTRAHGRIESYLREHGEDLSALNKIRILELLAPDPVRTAQLNDAFKDMWANQFKPAQIIGSVSASTARSARIHFAETNGSSWELSRTLRYAGKLVVGEKLREIVRANLERRRDNLDENELAQLLAQPDLGIDFLLSSEVTRLLSDWSAEGLSHWIKSAHAIGRADRRRLYLGFLGKALAANPGKVNWNDLGFDIRALGGGNLGALSLINALVEASVSTGAERRRVKLDLIIRALSPDGWNFALLNLVAGENEGIGGPGLAEILQSMVRPRKDEVAAVLTAYLRNRNVVESSLTATPNQKTWSDVNDFADELAQSGDSATTDYIVSVYLRQITPDADQERAIFGIQYGAGPPRSGVTERDRMWLDRAAVMSEPDRSVNDLAEALTRLHNQAPALKILRRRIDRGNLSEGDALTLMRALVPGELKVSFLRAYLLSDRPEPRGSVSPLIEELPSISKYSGQILRSQIAPLIAEADPTVLVERLWAIPSESVRLELSEKSLNKFYRVWEIKDVLRIQAALVEETSRQTFLLRYLEHRLPENPAALGAQLNDLLRVQSVGSIDELIEAIIYRAVFAARFGGPAPSDVFRSVAARMKSRVGRERVRDRLSGAT